MERLTLEQAHLALEAGPVVVPRPGRGLVRLAGPQRIWFLQNTITNDVEDVPPGRWVESCFLDLKGKVLAHFRAGVLEDEVLLDVDPPGTEPLVDWFVRYRFRTKVEIEDLSGRLTCFTVLGGSSSDGEVRRRGDGAAFGGRLGEVSTLDVYAPGLPAGLPLAPEELYHVLRVEAGAGRFGVDYGPDTLPQEAGLTRVVSVTKGCYVGQEVMARLHFRGHVNRTLRPLTFSDVPEPGRALIWDGQRVGRVTSAVLSPRKGAVGLGMVRAEVSEGERLSVEGGGDAVAGALPEGTKTTIGRSTPPSATG